jgi:hypothetical protein
MSRKRSPPHQHPLFLQFLIVIRYIRRTQPRLVLLENVSVFCATSFSSTDRSTKADSNTSGHS